MHSSTTTELSRTPFARFVSWVLVAIPCVALLFNFLALVKYGVDLPYWDDWKKYADGTMGRVDLGYLFKPSNDTLGPVGLFLDSLDVRYLAGHGVVYQALTLLGVLGGLLFLQWYLLKLAFDNFAVRACAFSACILMLQSDNYWGIQNLAYHQSIPLVCVLGILAIIATPQKRKILPLLGVLCLGLVSGFSYISGAFGILAVTAILLVMSRYVSEVQKKTYTTYGLALGIPAIISSVAQLWVIVGVQHGTHLSSVGMAYPWESDFWFFLLGKIGRSILLNPYHPLSSLVITLGGVLLLVAVSVVSVKYLLNIENGTESRVKYFIFISLVAVVVAYLFLVAAGRTNIRPENMNSPLEIFSFGFSRFHYYWVTLIWPWAVAIFLHEVGKCGKAKRIPALAPVGILILIGGVYLYTPAFRYGNFYHAQMTERLGGLECIETQIQQPGPVACPQIYPGDLKGAILNARAVASSFTRTFFYVPLPYGATEPRADFILTPNSQLLSISSASVESRSSDRLLLKTSEDPMVTFTAPGEEMFRSCRVLQISVKAATASPEVAQLFYLASTSPGFNETESRMASLPGGDVPHVLSFSMESASGFKNTFRFDPIMHAGNVELYGLEARCRERLAR